MMAADARSIHSIQVLRAIAATMVVLHHGLHDLDVVLNNAMSWQSRLPLAAGVDLFFVISGFVMVVSTQGSQGRVDAVLPFLRRRLARIWPIYAVTTLLFILLIVLRLHRGGEVLTPLIIIQSLLFFPFLRADGLMQPVFGLGWTLNYEMMFYLLFALSLPFRRPMALWGVIIALVALVAIGQFADGGTAFWFWSRPIILEFALGMAVAMVWQSGWRPRKPLGLAMILVGLAALVALHAAGSASSRWLAAGMPMTLVLAGSLAFGGSASISGRFLQRLGDASYALYLLHPFVLKGLLVIVGTRLFALSPWLHLFVVTLLSIGVSMVVWKTFERPVTRMLQGPPLPK